MMAEPTNLAARVVGIDEKLDQLSASVDKRFEQIDQRFERVDQRFEQVDQRFERVDQQFERVDQQFGAVLKEIAAEGLRTRRHFDVVAEQMKSERNLSIDMATSTREQLLRLTATNASDHVSFDARLTELEKRSQ